MYKILNMIPDGSSCTYYRNLLPSIRMRDDLKKCGIQVDNALTFNAIDSDYDCYIFSRLPGNNDVFPLIDYLRIKNKKIIWEIDDELWNVPESNASYKYFDKQKLLWFNYYFPMSTRIITSTENLAKSLSMTWHIDPSKIVVLENLIEEEAYTPFHQHARKSNDLIQIFWSGSSSHEGDFDPVDLLFLHYEKNDKVMFIFFGHIPDRFKVLPPSKLLHIPWTNRKYYEGTISLVSPHISLIPLENNQFNKCKSAIKYFEMTMSGSVCMASNVQPYSDVIEHRNDGLLCSNSDDWINICDELIKSETYREEIIDYAKSNVLSNYSWDTDNYRRRAWFDFFKSIPDL
jgi:glycosyltransferase involved in cell wall biosynthesis